MITDAQTNQVYFSSLFHKWYPEIAGEVFRTLVKYNITIKEIEETKDVWCRDYLPIQVSESKLIQFEYDPPYLLTKDYSHLRTNPEEVRKYINIPDPVPDDLIMDGGQVIKEANKAIVSRRVVEWNKGFGDTEKIRKRLEELFEVESIIFLQPQPFDFTGHMDGLIRFLDERNVVVSDFRLEEKWYRDSVEGTLNNHKLKPHFMPVAYVYSSQNQDSAVGIYMNYLHVSNLILFPVFNKIEDYDALHQIKSLYPKDDIVPIYCTKLAEEGGILNCVSWNIKST